MDVNSERQTVFTLIDRQEDEIVNTLRDLISIPTVVGHEGEGQRYTKSLYSKLGLKIVSFEADKSKVSRHPAFVDCGMKSAGRPNIIGIMEGDPAGRSLILNGHVDVVSPEPLEAWSSPPWEGTLIGRKLQGRGACDMKGGLVSNYFALKSLLQSGVIPGGTVMLQSVVEEEAGGGNGTLACLLEGFTADGMVITEPLPEISVAMTGVMYFKVKVTGRTAHAGRAHTGVNAIGKMNKIYNALMDLDVKRANTKHYHIFEKDYPRSCHLNIGTYQSGDWTSTVAGWAEMTCRMSFIPGEEMNNVRNEVFNAVNEAAEADEWLSGHPPEVTWFGWQTEPWEQDPNHPFVVMFKDSAEGVYGSPIQLVGRTAGLDTRFAKYFSMPAITFGPSGENIHGTNEYVDIDSLLTCTKVIASFIMDWCGTRSE
jgi:acetylornithine deacetylase